MLTEEEEEYLAEVLGWVGEEFPELTPFSLAAMVAKIAVWKVLVEGVGWVRVGAHALSLTPKCWVCMGIVILFLVLKGERWALVREEGDGRGGVE